MELSSSSDAGNVTVTTTGGQRVGEWPDSSSPDSEASTHDHEALRAKRGHVLGELLDTERIYVSELSSILKVMQCFY
jgi:hypothetical protein